jgi:hypothetical protein
MFTVRLCHLYVLAALLSACGGSSEVVTGQFVDAPVAGLRYETRTLSGVTNLEGDFKYREGERVTFYLGNLHLGAAEAAPVLSPFDLVPGAEPLTGTALKNGWYLDTKLAEVIDIATILQSFDRDQDLSNGIDIPAAVADQFVTGEEDFRNILLQVNENNILGVPAAVPTRRHVLQALYAGLGIASRLKSPVRMLSDKNADGINDVIERFEYDAYGNRTYREYEDFGGSFDGYDSPSYTRYEFDEFSDLGWHLSHDESDSDGQSHYRFFDEFNALGQILRRNLDMTPEDFIDTVHKSLWGEDFVLRQIDTYEQFYPEGEILRSSSRYTYVDNTEKIVRTNYAADGSVSYTSTTTQIRQDESMTYEQDFDSDGAPDSIYTRTFNADGLPVKEEWQITSSYDGSVRNDVFTWEYDVQGNQIRRVWDYLADGVVDETHEYFYDADGVLLRREKFDGDGILHSTVQYEYTDDENWWCLINSCSYYSGRPIARINGRPILN